MIFSVILSFLNCWLWALNFKLAKGSSLADKIVISTEQLMILEHPNFVQKTTNLKQTGFSNLPECSFTQSCSLWHFVIPILLFYIVKQ